MIFVKEIQEAVRWPDKRIFKDIGLYLQLGVPEALNLSFEWLSFEIMILFCGLIGVKAIAC